MNKEAWAQLRERTEKIIKQGLLDEIPDAKKDALRVEVLGDHDDGCAVINIFYYEVSLITFVYIYGPSLENETYDDFVSLEDEMECGGMIQLLNKARKKWGLEPDPEVEYCRADVESTRRFFECNNQRIYALPEEEEKS